jgi:hypothetical protein
MEDTRSEAQKQADILRRDLEHAERRRDHAASLESMAGWMGMCQSVPTLLVEEHKTFFGTAKRRTLTLDKDQHSALMEWLNNEARGLRTHAELIERRVLDAAATQSPPSVDSTL